MSVLIDQKLINFMPSTSSEFLVACNTEISAKLFGSHEVLLFIFEQRIFHFQLIIKISHSLPYLHSSYSNNGRNKIFR